jgi:potassium-transporting ATPase KdpC subunit
MRNHLLISLRMTVILTVLTCGIYPFAVYAVGQALFRDKANGSFVAHGSTLIGQGFTSPRFFHPRPSGAGNDGYDGTASGGTNLGPTSQKLRDAVATAVKAYDVQTDVPADAVTSSGSGLDPDISPENAYAQAPRVAAANHQPIELIRALIDRNTKGRFLGVYGEPRVNVLQLNLVISGLVD